MAQTTIQGTFLGDGTVTGAKIGADFISAQPALTSGLATTDEIIVSDAGVIKRMDISVLEIAATQITASGTLPALNGSNLTALNGTQITSGTVPAAQLGSNHDNARFLRGDNTWQAVSGAVSALSGNLARGVPFFDATTTTQLNGSYSLTYEVGEGGGNTNILAIDNTTAANNAHSRLRVRATQGDPVVELRAQGDSISYSMAMDSSDSNKFKISKSSAPDTNVQLILHADGELTLPLHPCFQTKLDSGRDNVTGGGQSWQFGDTDNITDRFDVGSNVSSTGIFTAPVTGKYLLHGHLTIVNSGMDSAHDNYLLTVWTSNRSYDTFAGLYAMRAATANIGATSVKDSVIADMDAGDTAKLLFYVYDGSQTIDINSGNNSYFSGYLLG